MNEPGQWLSLINKATWTLLLAALAVYVAWQLFRTFLPALVVVVALLAIYRMALSGRHRGW